MTSSLASVAGLKARVVAPRRAMNVVARASDEPAAAPEKAFSAKDMYGICSPTGYFDPADMLQGKDEKTIRRYREAELTHGRVSMLAVVGVIAGEKVEGIEGITGPAVHHFEQLPGGLQPLLLAALGFLEFGRAKKGWISPADGGYWELKKEYEMGELGFDPLGLYPSSESMQADIKNKELNNGRLAMMAIFGIVVQELKTGEAIFN